MMTTVSQRLPYAVGIGLLYLQLTGNVVPSNLVAAAIVGGALSLLVPPGERTLPLREWPSVILALLRHALTVAVDVFVNGLVVASLVIWRTRRVHPGLVQIRNQHSTEIASALDAHAITISPGQMVVCIEDNDFQTHCLQAPEARAAGRDSGHARHERIERLVGLPRRGPAQAPPGSPPDAPPGTPT